MTLGPWITAEDKAAVMAVLDSGDLMSGKQVALFEEELAAYFGKRHAVCVSSGTAALECAFVATGEGYQVRNDGYIAILSAARAAGHDPEVLTDGRGVGTDVLGERYEVLTKVHDCSHNFISGGARARLSCFSLNQNKVIGCVGGVVVTDDSVAAARMRQYRNHGRDGGPEIFSYGRNLRMTEMSAALGRSQLKRIDEIIGRRVLVAAMYRRLVGDQATGDGLFLYAVKHDKPVVGRRTLCDFRLNKIWAGVDDCTELMPVWPMMTMADCEEACRL